MGVITDSGGITEETTVMNIPCLTIRDNTERPETVELGTNILIGTNPKNINKLQLEGLVKAGAFDEINNNRQALYNSIPNIILKSYVFIELKIWLQI